MRFIGTQDTEKCTNCFKCVQQCFTKAITITQDENVDKNVIIDSDLCVSCGHCTKACKNNILTLQSDFDIISKMNLKDKKVFLILDTIYQSDFEGITYHQMKQALKTIGFNNVIENFNGFAIHSYLCNKHYLETGKTTLKSFCIPFNDFLLKFYPELSEHLAPIATPENISSRLIKEQYGEDTITIYATTCFSSSNQKKSKYDCDYIILTSEVNQLLKKKKVNPSDFETSSEKITIYKYDQEASDERIGTIEDCVKMLDFLKNHKEYKSLITPYWCNECFSSPVFTNNLNSYERKRLYQEYKNANYNMITLDDTNIKKFGDLTRFYIEQEIDPIKEQLFTEEEIEKTLESFGVKNKEDHFDCGACGYNTCRENAIAILKGKSSQKQCIPFISKQLSQTYKELDDAFALTIPNSRLEVKLKNTREYRDEYNKNTGKIKILGVVKDGSYRHVVNALKVAADLHSKGVLSIIGFDKDILVKTIIFHDIGKSQPDLKVGQEVDPRIVFEDGKLHAERSADLAMANYSKKGITEEVYMLIKYHHHQEKELPEDFPKHLLPMYRLFRIIDGISAGLTRRGNNITFDLIGSTLYIREDSQNPNYNRFYSIDLYKPESLKKDYQFTDSLEDILTSPKYKK